MLQKWCCVLLYASIAQLGGLLMLHAWADMHLPAVWSDTCAAAACLQRMPLLMWRDRILRSSHPPQSSRGRLPSRRRERPPPVSRTAVTSTCTWPCQALFMATCSMEGPMSAPGGSPAAAVLACCLTSQPPGLREPATAGLVAARPVRSCRHAAQHTSEQQLLPDGPVARHLSDAIYPLLLMSLEALTSSCPSASMHAARTWHSATALARELSLKCSWKFVNMSD